MKERDALDFWYAVNNTEIVLMPSRHLETFGNTVLNYHLVSELMDTPEQVRVREGRMLANQPQIITPSAYSETLLEGFGEEAERYVEWLKEHETEVRILQYGYRLKQESFSEHIVTDSVTAVVKQVEERVQEAGNPLSAVVLGVDAPWDVCLVKLFWEVIQESAGTNVRELQKRNLFQNPAGAAQAALRQEIDAAFRAASRNPALIAELAEKLQRHSLFEQYQDRFFALVRACKR